MFKNVQTHGCRHSHARISPKKALCSMMLMKSWLGPSTMMCEANCDNEPD